MAVEWIVLNPPSRGGRRRGRRSGKRKLFGAALAARQAKLARLGRKKRRRPRAKGVRPKGGITLRRRSGKRRRLFGAALAARQAKLARRSSSKRRRRSSSTTPTRSRKRRSSRRRRAAAQQQEARVAKRRRRKSKGRRRGRRSAAARKAARTRAAKKARRSRAAKKAARSRRRRGGGKRRRRTAARRGGRRRRKARAVYVRVRRGRRRGKLRNLARRVYGRRRRGGFVRLNSPGGIVNSLKRALSSVMKPAGYIDAAQQLGGLGASLVLPVILTQKVGRPEWNRGWMSIVASAVTTALAAGVVSQLPFRGAARVAGNVLAGGLLGTVAKAFVAFAPAQVQRFLPLEQVRAAAQPVAALPGPSAPSTARGMGIMSEGQFLSQQRPRVGDWMESSMFRGGVGDWLPGAGLPEFEGSSEALFT